MQLIVITPEDTAENELEVVNALFRSGLQRLHIRKPSFDDQAYKHYIASIDSTYHSHIVVHGNFDLYNSLNLGGIHLNSMARNNPNVWQTAEGINPEAISTSYHSWDEIIENDFHYGYVFISPMFDSISKIGYKGSIVPERIKETKAQLAAENRYCPSIIGLGGVSKNTIPALQKNGFDGAALLGSIWSAADPIAAYNEIVKLVTE